MNGDPGTWNCCESGHPHLFKTRKEKKHIYFIKGMMTLVKLGFFRIWRSKWKNRHPFYRSLYKSKSTLNMKKIFLFSIYLIGLFRCIRTRKQGKGGAGEWSKISLFSLKRSPFTG